MTLDPDPKSVPWKAPVTTLVLVRELDDALFASLESAGLTCFDVRAVHVRNRRNTDRIVQAWKGCAPEPPLVVLDPPTNGAAFAPFLDYLDHLVEDVDTHVTVMLPTLVEGAQNRSDDDLIHALRNRPRVAVVSLRYFPPMEA